MSAVVDIPHQTLFKQVPDHSADFVPAELTQYMKDHCDLSYFYNNMDIKRQLEEIDDINDISIVGEYKDLFTNVIEAYGEGTPAAVVATMCLEAVKEFELQYITPDDSMKERKRVGRGLLGQDSSMKKKKIDTLITKYSKRLLTEENYNIVEECKEQKKALIERKSELQKTIDKLREELKGSIEPVSSERQLNEKRDFKEAMTGGVVNNRKMKQKKNGMRKKGEPYIPTFEEQSRTIKAFDDILVTGKPRNTMIK